MIFRKLVNYPLFEISQSGIVRRIKNKKELKVNRKGIVNIYYIYNDIFGDTEKIYKKEYIDRLVFETFNDYLDDDIDYDKYYINHIDGDIYNNHIDNLELKEIIKKEKIKKHKVNKLEDLYDEEWKDILEYEGRYQISNYGRVKNRYNNLIKPYVNNKHNRILVSLVNKDNKSRSYSLPRLVLKHFNNLETKKILNIKYKDGNIYNNHINNIEFEEKIKKHSHSNNRINNRKKIMCITTGKVFNSPKEAAEYYNINNVYTLRSAAYYKGNNRYAGYILDDNNNKIKLEWRYINNENEVIKKEIKLKCHKDLKKVLCITTGKVFNSYKEANEYYNISNKAAIRNAANNNCKQKYAGYILDSNGKKIRLKWQYIE